MASISTFPIFHSISRPSTANPTPIPIFRSSISLRNSTTFAVSATSFRHSAVYGHRQPRGLKKRRAVEGEASVPEQEVDAEGVEPPAVTVSVSPSDMLTMFFQAEGTLNESAIPSVTEALEQTEGTTALKVQVLEGIASVELMKQITIQSTGVASSLIETIQNAGFKLQTLNLSFEDNEEVLV